MRVGLGIQELLRMFFEFRQAVLAANQVRLAAVLVFSRSRARFDGHAADWINRLTPLVQIITSSD
jgi:hypothetical protein